MHVEHFEKASATAIRTLILLAKKIGKLATHCKRLKDEGSSIRVEAEREDTKKPMTGVNCGSQFICRRKYHAQSL